MSTFKLKPESITLQDVEGALEQKLELSVEGRDKIEACRNYLEKKIASSGKPIYGVNTGFGSLCDTVISKSDLDALQVNLVRSHACGMGEEVPSEIVKRMLFLKAQNMVYGHSGVRVKVVEQLMALYNHDILPVVYQQGSLGASGDLAPLAHLSLPLMGEGEVYYKGKKMESGKALSAAGLKPIELKAKEGIALLNGTQFMTAYGCCILSKATKLLKWANTTACVSFDAFDGIPDAYIDQVHQVRRQPQQIKVAKELLEILEGSEIAKQEKAHVQDPYSLRCIPQVHGASAQWVNYFLEVLENEISAVTDNPTVFPEDDIVVSAGNFHGQPMALAFDSLCIALAELGSISERRTYKLLSGERGLPPFLVKHPGLNSGFMIPQYTAASIVSQNKQLCTPSSVDTIDSSNGQEDHVSMGANGATKCHRAVENLQTILSIELLTAFQALDFRELKSSPAIEHLRKAYRKQVPFVERDQYLHDLMDRSRRFLAEYSE